MVLKLTVSVLAAPNGGDIRKQFSYFESDRKMLVRIVFFFEFYTFLVSFYARMSLLFVRINKREM